MAPKRYSARAVASHDCECLSSSLAPQHLVWSHDRIPGKNYPVMKQVQEKEIVENQGGEEGRHKNKINVDTNKINIATNKINITHHDIARTGFLAILLLLVLRR